jgi:hypothetical protein
LPAAALLLLLRTADSVCRVERAVAAGSSSGDGKDDPDPALSTAIADLHKFSMMQSMYKSAVHLLEDLSSHSKLLHMPERAQVRMVAWDYCCRCLAACWQWAKQAARQASAW